MPYKIILILSYNSNFENALNIVNPSITVEVHKWYLSLEKKLTSAVPKFSDKIFYGCLMGCLKKYN